MLTFVGTVFYLAHAYDVGYTASSGVQAPVKANSVVHVQPVGTVVQLGASYPLCRRRVVQRPRGGCDLVLMCGAVVGGGSGSQRQARG